MREMKRLSDFMANQMKEAAEYRVAGLSWEAIAGKMDRAVQTLKTYPRDYPSFWKEMIEQARQAIAAEAADEAVHVLRNQLRTDDEKIKLDAAKKLIDHHEDDQPVKPTAKGQTSPLTQFLIHLEGLSDEELQQMLTSYREPGRSAGSDVPSTPPESASEA